MKTNDTAPRITHVTENTGDTQSFSLTDANFDPGAVLETLLLFRVGRYGFKLVMVASGDFVVEYKGKIVAVNMWERDHEGNITLETTLTGHAASLDRETALMIPDLEQCAAIALAKYGTVAAATI